MSPQGGYCGVKEGFCSRRFRLSAHRREVDRDGKHGHGKNSKHVFHEVVLLLDTFRTELEEVKGREMKGR